MVDHSRSGTVLGYDSLAVGELPEGCKLCGRGAKLVLLVTGLCPQHCFYCPLSAQKQGRDLIFANERPFDPTLENNDQIETGILEEAEAMRALGAGFTGGDPLTVPDRVIRFIHLLKDHFGDHFHIHLYTAGRVEPAVMVTLAEAGLDEIRFHPAPAIWERFEHTKIAETISAALKTSMTVGVEVPVLPDHDHALEQLIRTLDAQDLDFVNLNELEFSESNDEELVTRGLRVKDDVSAAVKGSQDLAYRLIEALETETECTLHYCSAAYKDAVQLRKRLLRRAQNTQRPYEVLTDDGTVLMGIITGSRKDIEHLYELLVTDYRVPEVLLHRAFENFRLEIAPWVLEKIYPFIPLPSAIIEEYPTFDRLEVERIPIEEWMKSVAKEDYYES